MNKALYLRIRRQQLTARGVCQNCQQPSSGYLCDACRRESSSTKARQMRLSRLRKDPFGFILVTLATWACLECGEPRESFHQWRCRHCRRKAA